MSKHTPTPWSEQAGQIRSDAGIVADCGHHIPAEFAACKDMTEGRANAQHIVHCVNHHDELVAALEWALDQICYYPSLDHHGLTLGQARAILAKVKGDGGHTA